MVEKLNLLNNLDKTYSSTKYLKYGKIEKI